MHYPLPRTSFAGIALLFTGIALVICAPDLAMAQASPFLTGASSLQTNLLGLVSGVRRLLDPCRGEIRWRAGDAHRWP
jgi:hypothetical protein